MPLTQCESCYVMTVQTCSDSIMLNVGLTPSTDYVIFVKDKFDTYYQQSQTSNVSGNLELNLVSIDLAFTPYGGSYEVTVGTSDDFNSTETLIIQGGNYSCINLSFYNSN